MFLFFDYNGKSYDFEINKKDINTIKFKTLEAKYNALKDETAPGGFDHDDLFVLIDKNRHIRSIAHGTDPKDVNRFMKDMEFLLKSEYSETK